MCVFKISDVQNIIQKNKKKIISNYSLILQMFNQTNHILMKSDLHCENNNLSKKRKRLRCRVCVWVRAELVLILDKI